MEVRIDGIRVSVPEGATILEACDLAGRYVPRLCSYPGLGCGCGSGVCCELCTVEVEGAGPAAVPRKMLACSTRAQPDMVVTTHSTDLQAGRLARLAAILERHPHICLTCPDRDGCTREECTFGMPVEARCCSEFGHCEIGRLVAFVDPDVSLPRRAVAVQREAVDEGRIRREPGLCVGCGRCVMICGMSPAAGKALRLEPSDVPAPGAALHAMPMSETLRASGCTFCGQCVMVCPTGAITAPGDAGARWLEGRRERVNLAEAVLPPESGWRPVTAAETAAVPRRPGVFQLADEAGQVLRIGGVVDLAAGLAAALAEPSAAAAARFHIEPAELYTQRESELLARFVQEHGHLPVANDLGDDLFGDDDLFDEDQD